MLPITNQSLLKFISLRFNSIISSTFHYGSSNWGKKKLFLRFCCSREPLNNLGCSTLRGECRGSILCWKPWGVNFFAGEKETRNVAVRHDAIFIAARSTFHQCDSPRLVPRDLFHFNSRVTLGRLTFILDSHDIACMYFTLTTRNKRSCFFFQD